MTNKEPTVQAMHRYCLKYRDLVRSGGTPTPEQDANFRKFSTICYEKGVAYDNHTKSNG